MGALEDGPDSDMKAITVRFARGGQSEKERLEKMREKSYEYQQKKMREEPWIPATFHQLKSQKWEEESQKMFCRRMDEQVYEHVASVPPNNYLSELK